MSVPPLSSRYALALNWSLEEPTFAVRVIVPDDEAGVVAPAICVWVVWSPMAMKTEPALSNPVQLYVAVSTPQGDAWVRLIDALPAANAVDGIAATAPTTTNTTTARRNPGTSLASTSTSLVPLFGHVKQPLLATTILSLSTRPAEQMLRAGPTSSSEDQAPSPLLSIRAATS